MFVSYISSPSCVPEMETKTRPEQSTAQRLQSYHKMSEQERDWFSVAPSTQTLYNITSNCFQELPVYQHQYQVNPPLWLAEVEHDCVFDYKKSDQRLAAEILANSRLNPNAEEFTPKTVIEMTGKVKDSPAEPNYICDINDNEESGSEYSSVEEEEDWDWDSDEQSTGQCLIVDPSEFEDLFTPSLLITNLSSSYQPCCLPHNNPRLRDANERFLQIYPDVEIEDNTEITCKTVKFSSDPTIILEPENLAEELQLARIGEFAARQADKERMERLIGPILTQTHRRNIYQKIYGETLSDA